MSECAIAFDRPVASTAPMAPEDDHLWAIVLAGGEGRRLAALTRELYGDARPKQYAALIDGRSLLHQTLRRIALLVPPQRTVLATMASHAKYLEIELAGFPEVHVLAQPSDRGTAAAVLLAALWIRARDPRARVVAFPADHFVFDDVAFIAHVADMVDCVTVLPPSIVLLGAQPTRPEADYGWIERGKCLGTTRRGPIHRVRRFREKPTPTIARVLFADGALWNTFVFAADLAVLLDACRRCVPGIYDPLVDGRRALDDAYRRTPAADFSRMVLESPTLSLAVAEMAGVRWCDLGSPERVADVLRGFGVSLRWDAPR